jgi:hypothetical protein
MGHRRYSAPNPWPIAVLGGGIVTVCNSESLKRNPLRMHQQGAT